MFSIPCQSNLIHTVFERVTLIGKTAYKFKEEAALKRRDFLGKSLPTCSKRICNYNIDIIFVIQHQKIPTTQTTTGVSEQKYAKNIDI